MKWFKKNIRLQLMYWFPAYVWAALIFYFSSQPITSLGTGSIGEVLFTISAYYQHIFVYGLLTFLLSRAFYNSKFKYSKIFAITTAVFYGMLNEVYQYFIPGRNFSSIDILFNFLGCILVQPLIILYQKFQKK